jgi:hypothetical protein
MFNPSLALRQMLISTAALTNLVPVTNIVSGDLPQGAKPGDGQLWITFRVRGGRGHDEIKDLTDQSFTFTIWAGPNEDEAARTIYATLYDLLYDTLNSQQNEATVMCCKEEVTAQDVTDPATGWFMCVAYWLISFHS